MSSRPVYIPKRRKIATADNSDEKNGSSSASLKRPFPKKHQQQPRFHGAFTGGFSAGHFNTVGSKEGWMPSQVKKRDQKLEDFMDDEDHADWGGPTRLRDDYGTKPTTNEEFENNNEEDVVSQTEPKSRNSGMTPFLPLKSMLEISHQTVGPRLLRRLGWREGGMAIVPVQEHTLSTRATGENDNNDGDLSKVHLSRRRLRKIRLQSTRITNLPPPKLDQCGLGFEPYRNAPEFQRYRDQRKQQARDRATYTTRNNNNVYRISDVAGEDVNPTNQATTPSASGDYLSFETAEDFVGKRSAAGFALRDDEDDAYDDGGTYNNNNNNTSQTTKSGIHLGNEYNAEVYEHEDSDEDIPSGIHHGRSVGSKNDKGAQSFSNSKDTTAGAGNVFAAWAGTDPIGNKSPSLTTTAVGRTATFDGKAPLAGFRLGISTDAIQTRYAGPEIPRDYTIQRHEFAEHENPYVLEAISNAVRLEQKKQRNSRIVQQHQKHQPNQRPSNGDTNRPLTKNFSSLADAMKNRFTSSTGASEDPSKTKGDVTSTTSFPAGLHLPNPVKEKKDDALSTETGDAPDVTRAKPDVIIIRTVQSFAPNPLVCKRFCVPTPSNARRSRNPGMTMDGVTENTKKKNKEAVYFEREILLKARKQQQQQQKDQDDKKSDEKAVETMALRNEETNSNEKPKGIDRPSMEKLRSIFDASSDESESSSDDEDDDENAKDENKPTKHDATAELNTETKVDKEKSNMNEEVSSSREIVEYQPKKDDETRNSSSSVDSNIDDDDSTSSHHRRRKRDKRHRRKHDHHHRSHRKRHKRKRSRSTRDKDYSDEDEEDNEEDREGSRAKRIPKEKKRKKKKYSSSSRHRSRKREKEDQN